MKPKSFILFLTVIIAMLLTSGVEGGKGKSFLENDKPFRIQKLNVLWQKGKNTIDEKRLKSFYEDLKSRDKEELTLKKLRSSNYEKANMREKQVAKQLSKILHKYGFENNDEFTGKTATFTADSEDEAPLFRDSKLDRLWKKAQSIESFGDKHLKLIKEEIRAYEDKLELYHELVSKLEENKAQSNQRLAEEENHIDADIHAREQKHHLTEEMNQKLKEKHRYLKQEYENLLEMVRNMTSSAGLQDEEFEEATVLQLWKLAEKSDFEGDELDSLKDELRDLQKRIQKLKYFETQLEKDALDGKEILEEHVDDKHKSHVQRKVKELGNKVDKIHADIEKRILQRHTEL